MRRVVLGTSLAVALVLGASPGTAIFDGAAGAQRTAQGATPFDARAAAPGVSASAAQGRALGALGAAVPGVTVRWNARFGTPATVVHHGGALTGPAAGTPEDAARRWLREHAALFGWSRAAADALEHVRTLAQPDGGPRVVLLHQAFDGVPSGSFGGSLAVTVDTSNRVLLVRAHAVRVPAVADGARLSLADAFRAATGIAAPAAVGTRAGWTELARGDLAGPHYARRIAFPVGTGPARPAWELLVATAIDEGWRHVVDAGTGEILFRSSLVRHAEAPSALVFGNHPGAPKGGTQVEQPLRGNPAASPDGWTAGGLTTAGNNASTATNWGVFIAPDGPGQVRPVGSFKHEFSDAWRRSHCGANPVSASFGTPDTPTYAQDALPATVNLFYHHNLAHDFWWRLGFTGPAGAMQLRDHEAEKGAEGDPLIGLVQAGAAAGDAPTYLGRDNAYMFPMPDGIPSWSGMFLFEPIPPAAGGFLAPCVDGDFDASVIYHEYAHAVTSRWVGGEYGNIDSYQGGSMGEAWSDFYGLHHLHVKQVETADVVGRYVTGNSRRGIRNWPLSEVPVGFGDLGYDVSGEEVHADGEIWAGILWDIREELAREHPQGGATLAAQLIADAMPVSGPVPTMVDMRDAVLAADRARTDGANAGLLWTVFARKGLGLSASSVDANDIQPRPGFDHRHPSRNGTVVGRVVDAVTGRAVRDARVIVGSYEARVSPVRRTAANGSFRVPLVAGEHPLTVQAKGYGSRTTTVTTAARRTTGVVLRLSPNVASTAAGAEVVRVSNPSVLGPPELALDDTEASTWWTDEDDDGPDGESFVVDLAGDRPVPVAEIQVSAMRSPGGSRFEALRNFNVYTSLDGTTWQHVVGGTFPTTPPRPVAPDLHYKRWTLDEPRRASFLRFVAERPQDASAGGVQVAEVQAFAAAAVTVAPGGGGAATYHDEGTALVATADANLVYTAMTTGACVYPPPGQGTDAWVSELPETFGDGTHVIDVRAEPLTVDPRTDIDLYFLSADCRHTGSIASTAPRETGTIPQGTRYVVSHLYTTLPASIVVEAKPGR